ncbi:MAG TPA: iron-only hydrogenase system regulator [Thermotogota bacterium]|nr:iron-only hydrogenase system regulator [Thermotogota bacterium]HPJ89885.1 iron-only hydrogenase system regulator [Thermotogota bacterium]HPR95857.1 iron-only hydrogenase system regulator [Thermotogota bacterium]
MAKIAVIGAVLEKPEECQSQFNAIISEYKHLVKGRLGLPMHEDKVSAISVIVVGELDEINSLTGKLGNISGVNVKTSISKKEI